MPLVRWNIWLAWKGWGDRHVTEGLILTNLLSVGGLLTAFGLSSATGLNAYLPLLVAGLLDRTGAVKLGEGFHGLSSWPILAVLAVLLIVDLVGDKVPAVDHIFHMVGMVIHPIAGALAFASTTGAVEHVNPTVALIIGAITGGSLHVARSSVRPVSTLTTAGIATPFVSAAEDVSAGVLTALAFLLPILVVLALAIVVYGFIRVRRRLAKSLDKPVRLRQPRNA
jgi:Domain of unknown function (DUF4126)